MPRFDGLRILIVDDDRESCDMMLEILRGYGATVRCVMSATDAIAALPEFKPDLVMSDIAMPDRDGYAVLAEVRALKRRSAGACQSRRCQPTRMRRTASERSPPALINIWPNRLIPRPLHLR